MAPRLATAAIQALRRLGEALRPTGSPNASRRSRPPWKRLATGPYWSIVALLAFGCALQAEAHAAESDKGVLADVISRALTTKTSSVSIGAVDGPLSSNVMIRDVVVSDKDGPWLKLDKARLVWSRLALLKRRLEVDRLDIGTLQILRRPLSTPPEPGAPKVEEGPLLPELPLKVIIKEFAVDKIVLGAPVIGVPAELAVSGAATLGPPSEGLDLRLDARRLDARGTFAARILFVPQGTKLSLSLNFDEPAGGLVARFASLPGLPPVHLALNGEGPLDAFHAKLAFAAGPDIGAEGGLDLTREGSGRRLTTKLQSRIAGLLPPLAAGIFAGQTALDGDIVLGDDGSVAIKSLSLVSAAARLRASGGVDAAHQVALAVHAEPIPGVADIGKFDLEARATGPLEGFSVQALLQVRGARFSLGRVGALDASFTAAPNGAFSDPATRVAIVGNATASGLAFTDSALQDAVGKTFNATLRADASLRGALRIAKLRVNTASLDARFTGEADRRRVHGSLAIEASDLAAFTKQSGMSLRGALKATAELEGAPAEGAFGAELHGRVTDFKIGIAALDGFAGGELTLRGGVAKLAGGGYGFKDLRLVGAHGAARIDGTAGQDKAAVHAEIDIPEMKAIDPRVAGRAQIVADLSGSLPHLDASVNANLKNGRLMNRPTPNLEISGDAHDLTGLVDARATLNGTIDSRPATGSVHFVKRSDGGWAFDDFAIRLASARVAGDVTIDPDKTANGRLSLEATNLDDLSPLVLTRLGGAIESEIELSAQGGRQDIVVRVKSPGLSAFALKLKGLNINARVDDLFGQAIADGAFSVARVTFGGEEASDIHVVARPAVAASDLELRARARGLLIKANGSYAGAARRLTLASLSAQGSAHKIFLASPASLTFGAEGLDFGKVALRVDAGHLDIAGRAGAKMDLRVVAASLPLSAIDFARPGLGLAGAVDAEAALRGAPAALEGEWRAKIVKFTTSELRAAGLPALQVRGSGRLSGGRTTLDVSIDAAKAGALRLTGSAPLNAEDPLDLRVAGELDLGLANSILGAAGRRASGAAVVDLRLTGATSKPLARGSIAIRNASFSDDTSGFKAKRIEASIIANGEALDVTRMTASTPNGGSLAVSGRVRLDPEAGFPGSVHISGRRAQLLANAVVAATADVALDVSGPLARNPRIAGRIDIVSMDINIPERLSGALRPLAGARHVRPGHTARLRLALAAKAKATARGSPLFETSLAVVVSAPNRIYVRGRGLDAELSGDLKIGGSSSKPSITGGFDLRRGVFSILGKRLDFTSGRAVFRGDMMPELNFQAQTTAGDVTAMIAITGPAAAPTFTFSSQPELPQDEILSRILFQKPSGDLSAFQALQLANTVSSLSGRGDAFETLRRSLGVDSLDVGSGASGGPMVGVRRAINDRLSLGVTTGARPEDNGVSLDLDVTRHLRLQVGEDAKGASTAGVRAQWEY